MGRKVRAGAVARTYDISAEVVQQLTVYVKQIQIDQTKAGTPDDSQLTIGRFVEEAIREKLDREVDA